MATAMTQVLFLIGVSAIGLMTIGMIFAKLYRKATKEESFVRTGLGGEKVIMNGGALVLPVLHDLIWVNMRTLKLEVRRADVAALITKDRMRVDVTAEFYVRVAPNKEAISTAAQTLGIRTLDPNALKELIEGKFVDVLRSVAAEMAMEELHEKRADFVQLVQNNVKVDLEKNGLELETVSLTALDQTDPSYFRPENAFDAEGLTQLTKITESRRKLRNDIERETEVEIQTKNLEAEQRKLTIKKDEEYAKLEQVREIETRKAHQESEIATERAQQKREADEAEIQAKREVELARIIAERAVEEEQINKERTIEEARIAKQKNIEIAEQERAIAVAVKSKEQSVADAEADRARALAVKEEEQVVTVRETAKAERQKEITLIEAKKIAEQDAIEITVAAEAKKMAAEDDAESVKIKATADAEAEKTVAEAKRVSFDVEAEGKRSINEAENILSKDIIEMQVKMAMLKYLPEIVRESVKPMEKIDGIKIFQIDGLNGFGGGGSAGGNGTGGEGATAGGSNLADQVTNAALRYKAQSPLVDSLLKEIGIDGGDINSVGRSVIDSIPPVTPKANGKGGKDKPAS